MTMNNGYFADFYKLQDAINWINSGAPKQVIYWDSKNKTK